MRSRFLLILDAGGVLVTEPVPVVLRHLAQRAGTTEQHVETVYKDRLYDDCWSGRISGQQMWERLAAAFAQKDGGRYQRMFEHLLDPLPVCDRLREGAQHADLALLSNHHVAWVTPTLQEAGVWDLFKVRWVSAEMGCAKPRDEIFRPVREHAAAYDRVLFVDDAPANIAAAARHDIPGLLTQPGWEHQVDEWLNAPE